VFYYQGLHDVASVLLLQLGERPAAGVLAALLVGHLRDASRESLDATMEVLGLMGAIVEAADPPLARFTQVRRVDSQRWEEGGEQRFQAKRMGEKEQGGHELVKGRGTKGEGQPGCHHGGPGADGGNNGGG
jgi:hypothetical protein